MATLPPSSPTPTLPPCTRGLTAADLSAHRDGASIGGDPDALVAHIANCPACRARLEQMEQLADALRAERTPEPDERLWLAVRRAAEAGARHRFGRRPLLLPGWRDRASTGRPYTTAVRPLWGGLGAVAAVLLLVLGFAQLFTLHGASTRMTHTPTATATLLPTPTATPASQLLKWRAVTLPQEVTPGAIPGFAISPIDGHIAWICAAVGADSFRLWETTDAGLSWHRATTFAPATGGQSASCNPAADETDARAVAVTFSWGSGGVGTLTSSSYYSQDDGVHWRLLPDNVTIREVGTLGSATYALLDWGVEQGKPPAGIPLGLVTSTNGLGTWRSINLPEVAYFNTFWLGEQPGEIYAATGDGTLWRSVTGGASWIQLNTPGSQITLGIWIATQHRWIFCGWLTTQILCSTDLGKTWVQQPTLTYTTLCAAKCAVGGTPYPTTQLCAPSSITPGGSLIASCPTNGGSHNQLQLTMYVLLPGAAAWTTLALAPGAPVSLTPAWYPGGMLSEQIWWWLTQQGDVVVTNAPF